MKYKITVVSRLHDVADLQFESDDLVEALTVAKQNIVAGVNSVTVTTPSERHGRSGECVASWCRGTFLVGSNDIKDLVDSIEVNK